ncbi:MAG: Gfo/Idh/MocA family oxidoreductase [Nitrospira sp.]|jgi:predicted dehydrogenase|nr:Gfo/Idh/MocA family oxidoreductase [Nitrospira sp. BO4]
MIGIGVIGFGYWGPNLVRNFHEMADSRVLAVSDLRMDRLALAASRYPGIGIMQNPSELIRSPAVDAVVIATPVSSHFQLAMEALKAGKHVLVEKPLAITSEQAWQLIEEAEKRRLVLMVDHTFVYTGSVRKMKELIDGGEVGDLYYYDSVRVNLGLFQHDVNVLWDLAVHDLSIMEHLLPIKPRAVSATGITHFPGQPDNIAYLTLFYDSSLLAHVHVNWLAPVKVRRTLIGGSRKMIMYDDVEPSEKVKVYDKGVTRQPQSKHSEKVYQMMVGYRAGDMWAPQLDNTEALRHEARHFLDCIGQSRTPITNGEAGARVVEILEAATLSLAQRGTPIELHHMKVAA